MTEYISPKELALIAGAAGYMYDSLYNECCTEPNGEYYKWDPLNNNGDAFKLALDMDISYRLDRGFPDGEWIVIAGCTVGDTIYGDQELCGDDKRAATRRVICRLAETIGQDLLATFKNETR